jgi:hypothetical protein
MKKRSKFYFPTFSTVTLLSQLLLKVQKPSTMRIFFLLISVFLVPFIWVEANNSFLFPTSPLFADTLETDDQLQWIGWEGREIEKQPEFPFDEIQQEGKVVINLCADETGKLIRAQIIPGATNLWDPVLFARVKEHALSCRLEPLPGQTTCGKLVYSFRMK